MKTYTAIARRSGDWWAISVPDLRGVHTQVRRLNQAEDMAREAIALFLNVPISEVKVDVRPDLPEVVAVALRARQDAAEAEQQAMNATATAVHELLTGGLSVRETGRLLNLSPARVWQLSGSKPRGPASRGKARLPLQKGARRRTPTG